MTKPGEVAAVFLRHRGKVLLLRRSARVSTYPNKWAGVSGYLEREPLAQAHTELREEVFLEREDVSALIRGEPLELFDENTRMAWRAHPFLANVKDPGKIRLNWENKEMRWIEPAEITRLETVPGLNQALRRVWTDYSLSTSS